MELIRNQVECQAGYAVVWCPDFRLQAVMRWVHESEIPVVLVDDSKRQSLVLCGNERATRFGVEAGMKTVQAMARCPELRVEQPSPPSEMVASRALLETAWSWVPGVEETEQGMVTLDLSTLPREQWEEGARRVRGRLHERGMDAVIGLGETPSLARIAAMGAWQQGERVWHLLPERRLELLDTLPLGVAEMEEELCERLSQWGIKRLGAFARLSREAVAARLGEEGVALWLRLTGRWRQPLCFAKWEELLEECEEFEHELSDREPLLFVVNRLLEQLLTRVGQLGRAVGAVHVVLSFSNGQRDARRLALPEPVLDHELLFHLVSGHLDVVDWKAAVDTLRLRIEPSLPIASQRLLFGAGLKNRFQFEDTMKRLRRLVGSERVGSPRSKQSHRPNEYELGPLLPDLEWVSATMGPPVTGYTLCQFQPRVRAEVRWQGRERRPSRIESPLVSGDLVGVSGPWERGGDWWHRGRSWQRREWDVEVSGKGVFRLVESEGECFLEGRYD